MDGSGRRAACRSAGAVYSAWEPSERGRLCPANAAAQRIWDAIRRLCVSGGSGKWPKAAARQHLWEISAGWAGIHAAMDRCKAWPGVMVCVRSCYIVFSKRTLYGWPFVRDGSVAGYYAARTENASYRPAALCRLVCRFVLCIIGTSFIFALLENRSFLHGNAAYGRRDQCRGGIQPAVGGFCRPGVCRKACGSSFGVPVWNCAVCKGAEQNGSDAAWHWGRGACGGVILLFWNRCMHPVVTEVIRAYGTAVKRY